MKLTVVQNLTFSFREQKESKRYKKTRNISLVHSKLDASDIEGTQPKLLPRQRLNYSLITDDVVVSFLKI